MSLVDTFGLRGPRGRRGRTGPQGPRGETGASGRSLAAGSGRDGDLDFNGDDPVTINGVEVTPNGSGVYDLGGDEVGGVQGQSVVIREGVTVRLGGALFQAWHLYAETGALIHDDGTNASTVNGGALAAGGYTQRTNATGGAGRTTAGAGNGTADNGDSYGGSGGNGGAGGAGGGAGVAGVASLDTPAIRGSWRDVSFRMLVGAPRCFDGAVVRGGTGGAGGGKATTSTGNSGAGGGPAGVCIVGVGRLSGAANLTIRARGGQGSNAPGTVAVGGGGGGGGGPIALWYGEADGEATLVATGGIPGAGDVVGNDGVAGSAAPAAHVFQASWDAE